MRVEPIKPQDLTIEDLELLETSTRLSHDSTRPSDIVRFAMDGKVIIFKFEGDKGETGIMAAEFIQRKTGIELFFLHFAGNGMASNTKFIYDELEKFCKEFKVKWMSGLATEFLATWLEKNCDFEKRHIFVLKEIPNG